jgi:alpha-L-rhamnosidase
MHGKAFLRSSRGVGYNEASEKEARVTATNERPEVDWRAEWIWHGEDPAPYHCFLYARRRFTLAARPRSALLHITATDRYRLFVNGAYLGRGPERCDPRFQSYDTHDLAARLVQGENCIAVQAYFYGCNTGFGRDGRPGLLAQLSVDGEATIVTGQAWKARPARAWRRDAKPIGIGVGVTEVFDARLDPPDWMETGFDDSTWEQASLVPLSTSQWCSNPEPRHIPFLQEGEATPVAVLGVGETLELDDTLTTVDVPEMMAREIHEPLLHARLERPEALRKPAVAPAALGSSGRASPAGAPAPAVAATSPHAYADNVFNGIRDPFVLLDFGTQINAFPSITVEGEAGSIVDMAYGEQLVGGRVAPIMSSTRCADRFILRDGRQTFQAFEWKSFRYLQLSFRTGSRPVLVHGVRAVTWRYPAEVRGSFRSGEVTFDRLWNATVATTDLCTEDAFMDSPLREKRNWLGDGSHALLGVWAAWGDVPVVRRYFNLVRQGLLGDGMLRMFYPGSDFTDPKTKIVSTIPQHALVWAARVWEYYLLFGDRSLLEDLAPVLRDLDAWCERHVNAEGLMDRLPYGCWLDWTPADIRGAGFGTNAFRLHMLDDLARISEALGDPSQSALWQRKASGLRKTMRRRYWDDARGLFVDSIFRGKPTGVASELGNALALLFDVADGPQRARVTTMLSAPHENLAPATPLFFHYVPQALFRAGASAAALALIRDRFEPMMAVSQTIWEGWSRHAMLPQITEASRDVPDVVPGGRIDSVIRGHRPCAISLAHCGGLGSGLLLLTEVLGIAPARPGFDGCVISPKVGLLASASGTFPSPHGDIGVAWVPSGEGVTVTINLPQGLVGELRLPSMDPVALPAGKRTSVRAAVRT